MAHAHGQAAIEQLIVMMILFVVLFAVFVYSNIIVGSARVEQAYEAARAVASAADKIGAMDAGTKMYVDITMPDGVVLTNISQSEILIRMETGYSGETDVVETPNARVAGNLPTGAGVYTVQLEVSNTSTVDISAVNKSA